MKITERRANVVRKVNEHLTEIVEHRMKIEEHQQVKTAKVSDNNTQTNSKNQQKTQTQSAENHRKNCHNKYGHLWAKYATILFGK